MAVSSMRQERALPDPAITLRVAGMLYSFRNADPERCVAIARNSAIVSISLSDPSTL